MNPSIYNRSRLLQYDRQLVTARRLARVRRLMNKGEEDPSPEEMEARRRELVERVSREVIENLIIVGSDSPVVKEVREDLERWFGGPLLLEYPPSEARLHIYKVVGEQPREVASEESEAILARLWEITLDKVNSTML